MKIENRTIAIIVIWILFCIAAYYANFAGVVKPLSLKKPFSTFPQQLGNWTIHKYNIRGDFKLPPNVDDYMLRWYTNPEGNRVELFMEYFGYTRPLKSPHSAEGCLDGSGWKYKYLDPEVLKLSDKNMPDINVKKIVAKNDYVTVLIFLCYKIGNNYDTSLYRIISAPYNTQGIQSDPKKLIKFISFRINAVIKAVVKKRNDSFMLRASYLFPSNEEINQNNIEKHGKELLDIIHETIPILENEYFP